MRANEALHVSGGSPGGATLGKAVRRRHGTWWAGTVLVLLGTGCISVNVGPPKTTEETRILVEEATIPTREEAIAVRATHAAPTTQSVLIGLEGDVRAEYPRTSRTVTTAHSEQRRLAFGLFPGAAEEFGLPNGAEKRSCTKPNYPTAFVFGALPAGLFVGLGTVRALFWELPCGRYDCWKEQKTEAYSHVGLVGFHKYTAFIVHKPETGPERPEESNFVTTPHVKAVGPYSVEFRIPGLGHYDRKSVGVGETAVSFPLPEVSRDCAEEASAVFRRLPGHAPGDAVSARLLEKAEGRPLDFTLYLHASSDVPGAPPYEILAVRPLEDGKYTVRAAIRDPSATFRVAREVEREVRRQIRADYLGKHPEAASGNVRESIQWQTEDDGRVLEFTGWAFSIQPVADGWSYNAYTHRGTVRLRLSGGMPPEEAKRWARENIEAIAREKNVLLRAGSPVPDGAAYRSLREEFRDGVLAVDFEASE